ncbi:MAG: hypothetical protein KatS3mg108_1801 [Isosphaeraceae bacterium]|nr:MAG: hypothetical protein KatS3mg108_1801 [Isosphaeraceae bacterium]
MSPLAGTSRRIVIDTRSSGPYGRWSELSLEGQTIRQRLAKQAAALSATPAHWIEDDGELLPSDFVLRSDRLYDSRRLVKAYRSGRSADRAVVWRLDSPSSWEAAPDELLRRASYQPWGRFWAGGLARALARRLAPTPVRPNALTIAAALCFLTAAGLVAAGLVGTPIQILVAALLAAALVFDTADGHLARLQGTCSSFGRWLDAVLDEACDLALHVAIAWSHSVRDRQVGWLLIALAYCAGKHLFQTSQAVAVETPANPGATALAAPAVPGRLRGLIRWAGHADIRWHVWIGLALVGRLDLALIAYAPYYPARALASGWARRYQHG